MSASLVISLLSCLVCAIVAGAILLRDPQVRLNRVAATLMACASFWAFCEVLWTAQPDAPAALFWVRLSALGWVWLGPLTFHLLLEIGGETAPRPRRWLAPAYTAAAGFVLAAWLTPWMFRAVEPVPWGWAYRPGPLYPAYYGLALVCVGFGFRVAGRAIRVSPSLCERARARAVSLAIGLPMLVASITDSLLPGLGIDLPRAGTASFGILGALLLRSFHRYGALGLVPVNFAEEILETLPDGVAMVRLDGRIRSANGALVRLLGTSRGAVLDLRLSDQLSHPAESAAGDSGLQCELETLDGRRVPVAVRSTVLHDRAGEQIGLVVVLRDRDEVVELRDRLLLSGRLAAVGELAAGIAHEINNPLAFVRANLTLLRQHWTELAKGLDRASGGGGEALVSEGEELIEESLEGVERAAAIVRDVRGLAHAGGRQREVADMNQLLEGVLRLAAPQLPSGVRIERVFGRVPPVWGAPQELQQVFLNLLLNAAHAIGERGTIRIETGCDGDFVVAHIADDGCGIDPAIRERIFDPFFTTKPVGEGTGLGLGIAYGIVTNHGGEVSVESEPGSGSCFSVRLPVATDTLGA